MNIRDRIAEARMRKMVEAAERWQERQSIRDENERALAQLGGGGADSMARQIAYQARENSRQVARAMKGRLPIALERRIGPSLDWDDDAPSDAARKAGRPVVRLTTTVARGVVAEPIATGFMITRALLITNHHVFARAADARGYSANFGYEKTEQGTQLGTYFELDPDAFFHSDEALDFAVVAVKPTARDGETLDALNFVPLIEATPKILTGQPVNIIQHPEGAVKTYAYRQNRLIDILEEGYLHYETDTAPGSSGSPAFSANWDLVALHHSGVPAVVDGKVMAVDDMEWDPETGDDQVKWIANEGIRVSSIVKALRAVTRTDPEQLRLLEELYASTVDPLPIVEKMATAAAAAAAPSPAGGPNDMTQIVFNITGPVTINVQAGAASAPAASIGQIIPGVPIAPAPPLIAVEKKQNFDRNYALRKGYDPGFLGVDLPAPTVSAERLGEMLVAGDEPLVLKYHHYSLAMNGQRRLCMWTASNLDYSQAARDDRGRAMFGGEDWRLDPRIDEKYQISDPQFYQPANNVDRGHIVRRDDNCWGATELEREYGNADSYHWTNCTPQHEAFNQEHPKASKKGDLSYKGVRGIWGALESYLVRQLDGVGERASLLAGPVLDPNDPVARFAGADTRYPLKFWKIVSVVRKMETGEDRLFVYGFVLDQSDMVQRFGLHVVERIDPGPFKAFLKPLAEIEMLTGLRFAQIFHDHDMRAERGELALESDESLIKAFDRTADPAQPVATARDG